MNLLVFFIIQMKCTCTWLFRYAAWNMTLFYSCSFTVKNDFSHLQLCSFYHIVNSQATRQCLIGSVSDILESKRTSKRHCQFLFDENYVEFRSWKWELIFDEA